MSQNSIEICNGKGKGCGLPLDECICHIRHLCEECGAGQDEDVFLNTSVDCDKLICDDCCCNSDLDNNYYMCDECSDVFCVELTKRCIDEEEEEIFCKDCIIEKNRFMDCECDTCKEIYDEQFSFK